ncbi:hypothetical protein QBC39DRAFT_391243 [Podospora conica]|nr:hypothetical protein QBC39DRAFT_391243 [Schizothecium conicum]
MSENTSLPPQTEEIHEQDLALIAENLGVKARADAAARISPEGLDAKRRDILIRAISNVVSTENAIFTYAQIIDGLPTADVAWDRRLSGLYGDHPLDEHEELCPGAMEKAREVCQQWNVSMLAFDPQVIAAYRQATPGTKLFNTRLVELVAVAVHQFAALLYRLELRMHKGDIEAIAQWVMPRPRRLQPEDEWVPIPPRPSIFNHHAYLDADIYPDGAADVVGYWAEDRIFGGVVVFNRRAERDQVLDQDPPNVYLHPCREKCTYRVTQLLDHQQQALVDFLLSEPPPSPQAPSASPMPEAATPCPLPILVDDRNRVRVDAQVALTYRGIFRDIWERKPLTSEQLMHFYRRPQGDLDYPEAQLETLAINRAAGVPIQGRFKRYLDGEEASPAFRSV